MATRVAKKPAKRTAKATAYQMYVDGAFVSAKNGKTFDVFDPSTEQPMATCPAGEADDVDRAVQAARRAFDGGLARRTTAQDRGRILFRLAERSASAPPSWPRSRPATAASRSSESEFDMADVATCFEYYGGLATKIHGEVLPVPDNAMSLRAARADRRGRPDHPVELPAADGGLEARAGALRGLHHRAQAGRADAAHASSSWPRLRADAGSRPASSTSSPAAAKRRARRSSRTPMCDKIAFTGSAEVGRRSCGAPRTRSSESRSSSAASRRTSSSPTPTSRRPSTARCSACSSTRARCARRAAGSWCSGRSTSKFVDAMAAKAQDHHSSARAWTATNKMGPLVSREQFDRVVRYLQIGRKEAKLAARRRHAQAARRRGCYVEPTIFYDVDNHARIAREEIFGPVVSVIPFEDEAHALRIANATPLRPRRRGVDPRHLPGVPGRQGAEAGIVWVNHMQPTYVEAPWGGYKESASAASWATGASRSTWRPSRYS